MKVLWFSVTPSLYNPFSNSHNGGGWIASLEQIVRKIPEIDLGIAFYFGNSYKKDKVDDVIYYCLPQNNKGMLTGLLENKKKKEQERINLYLKVIEDFKPDIIQIFGSENDFGLICNQTNVPVVIHIQGSLPPYHNALFPIGINKYDFFFQKGLPLKRRFIGLRSEPSFRKNAEREIKILKSCKYFMGRTYWDKNLIELFNPEATYFHCEEALRDSFLNSKKKWDCSKNLEKLRFISVISNPWYKGADLILKTSKLLKEQTELDFEWNIFGVSDIRFFENKYKINAKEVNVNVKGAIPKDVLVHEIITSILFIHPSYIDNSPNSICEAQYLGVPILATNVGGISSLIKNDENGILFPTNDPYTLAGLIKSLLKDKEKLKELSLNGIDKAQKRHNPENVKKQLLAAYNSILKS